MIATDDSLCCYWPHAMLPAALSMRYAVNDSFAMLLLGIAYAATEHTLCCYWPYAMLLLALSMRYAATEHPLCCYQVL